MLLQHRLVYGVVCRRAVKYHTPFEAPIEQNGSEAEELMYKYYDQTQEKASELFDNEVPMEEAMKQLGIE